MRTAGLVWQLVALIVAVPLALTGCADDTAGDEGGDVSPSPQETVAEGSAVDADELEGTTYVSTSVQGRDLVDGTEITLSFKDGAMSVSAGCNTMFGAYEVDASGTLRWAGPPASTLIGCSDDLADQDQWLTTLFTEGVTATSESPALTLTDGAVVVEMASESSTNLDELLGRTWTLVGTIDGETVSRLPRGVNRPFLSVRADGLARLNTGCNVGRTTVRVDGDQLVFGHATTTRRSCEKPAREIEQAMLAIVDQGRTDHVEAHDRILTLSRAGDGLVFELNRTE
ncbi:MULTISPECIES: META domain-containing protein [unclassified Nocardioides]|uniref:META domain-containing protein n=1 Tax=unclassified Nocardioides TaxID=2615069 RepID=UPI003615F06A